MPPVTLNTPSTFDFTSTYVPPTPTPSETGAASPSLLSTVLANNHLKSITEYLSILQNLVPSRSRESSPGSSTEDDEDTSEDKFTPSPFDIDVEAFRREQPPPEMASRARFANNPLDPAFGYAKGLPYASVCPHKLHLPPASPERRFSNDPRGVLDLARRHLAAQGEDGLGGRFRLISDNAALIPELAVKSDNGHDLSRVWLLEDVQLDVRGEGRPEYYQTTGSGSAIVIYSPNLEEVSGPDHNGCSKLSNVALECAIAPLLLRQPGSATVWVNQMDNDREQELASRIRGFLLQQSLPESVGDLLSVGIPVHCELPVEAVATTTLLILRAVHNPWLKALVYEYANKWRKEKGYPTVEENLRTMDARERAASDCPVSEWPRLYTLAHDRMPMHRLYFAFQPLASSFT